MSSWNVLKIGLLRLGVEIGILVLLVLRFFVPRKRLDVWLLRRWRTSMVRVRVVVVVRRVLIRTSVLFFVLILRLVLVVMLR